MLDSPARFTLRLAQTYGTGHILGRLRVAATEFSGGVRVPPAEVVAALMVVGFQKLQRAG